MCRVIQEQDSYAKDQFQVSTDMIYDEGLT